MHLLKPDSPTSSIVAALRQAGASVEHHEGSAGSPDLVWGYRGRMGFAEVKVPGKEHGVCGCDSTQANRCIGRDWSHVGSRCTCKGHTAPAGERKIWHRQLAWHEAWQGAPVSVWTTVEEALATVLGQLRPEVGDRYVMEPHDEI